MPTPDLAPGLAPGLYVLPRECPRCGVPGERAGTVEGLAIYRCTEGCRKALASVSAACSALRWAAVPGT